MSRKFKLQPKEVIIGFDLGSNLGYCTMIIENGVIDLHTQEVKLGSGIDRHIKFHERLERLGNRLEDFKEYEDLDIEIWHEYVARHRGHKAAHVYGALRMQLMMWAHSHGYPCKEVGVTTLKKFATGAGNANKELMIESAVFEGGTALKNEITDNEADAFWVAEYGRCVKYGLI